jgi:hypothetical protein
MDLVITTKAEGFPRKKIYQCIAIHPERKGEVAYKHETIEGLKEYVDLETGVKNDYTVEG